MRFSTRIFLAVFGVSFLSSLMLFSATYAALASNAKAEFMQRYNTLGQVIGGTFREMEKMADQTGKNALGILSVMDQTGDLPDDAKFRELAKSWGLGGLYAIDHNGRFIRSSGLPIKMQKNSLFDYCSDYRKILTGEIDIQYTPVVPGWPHDIPQKFVMVPNTSHDKILETAIDLQYISEILREAVQSDANIQNIGLYSPSGYEMGSIDRSGKFRQGGQDVKEIVFKGTRLLGDQAWFGFTIPASTEDCCECKQKGVVATSDPYQYNLRIGVSLDALQKEIMSLRTRLGMMLAIAAIVAFALARFLSRRLVGPVQTISETANRIVKSGDLALRVNAPPGRDEVAVLAESFNEMVETLHESQEKLVETARLRAIGKLASHVAHDIRSPLAALEVASRYLKDADEQQRGLIRDATRRINDIANNLLSEYRRVASNTPDTQSQSQSSPLPELVTVLVSSLISEKRVQFTDSDTEITLATLLSKSTLSSSNGVYPI